MKRSLFGLQRRGQWLGAPISPPSFGIEPIWAVPSIDEALEQAQLLRNLYSLSVEPRRIP